MADNTVGVRDYLGQLIGSGNVGYDEKTKGVTASVGGKTYNLGNAGMTLGDDGSYYSQNTGMLDNLLLNKTGFQGVRNTVQAGGGSVGYADGQAIINGQNYNTNGMINVDGSLYADPNFLNKLNSNNTYNNTYQKKQDDLFNKLYNSKFSYNVNTDSSLHAAQKQAQNLVTRDAAQRGILNSTDAEYYSGLATSQLAPQYEQMAYSRYQDENAKLSNLSGMLSNMSSQQLGEWQANNTQKYNNTMMTLEQQQQTLNERQNKITEALNRTNMTGFVNNQDAIILGVDVGTMSQDKRKAAEDLQTQIELELRQNQYAYELADYNYEQEMKMYKQKSDIDVDANIRQYKETTGTKTSGGGGGGNNNDYDNKKNNDPVETALQAYLTNNGLGSFLEMEPNEIAEIINSVVSDEETRQRYYQQYGITANAPTQTPERQPIITSTGYVPVKPQYGTNDKFNMFNNIKG